MERNAALVQAPVELHPVGYRVATQRTHGAQILRWRSHHRNSPGFLINQNRIGRGNWVGRILRLEDDLVRRGRDVAALRLPVKLALGQRRPRQALYERSRRNNARVGKQSDGRSGRASGRAAIGSSYNTRDGLPGYHTQVRRNRDGGPQIVSGRHNNLHIANHLPDFAATQRRAAPFLHHHGHIINARRYGRIPSDLAGSRVLHENGRGSGNTGRHAIVGHLHGRSARCDNWVVGEVEIYEWLRCWLVVAGARITAGAGQAAHGPINPGGHPLTGT